MRCMETRQISRGSEGAHVATRCSWADAGNQAYLRYHDQEWGVPIHDDCRQFEFLTLESAQAGLSWATILNKREGYREAFADFQPDRVARFTRRKIEALVTNPAIVRNRAKIEAAVGNARVFLEIAEEYGSFDTYIWSYVEGRPVQNRWEKMADVPSKTGVSDALSKDLKARGFRFLGSIVCYAHMQAAGLVNDHLVGCFRHREVASLTP